MKPANVGDFWRLFQKKELPEVRIVLKADANGTLRVAQRALLALAGEQANLRIVRAGVGDVVPSDVFLAETAKAKILGFGVRKHKKASDKGVEIETHDTLQAVVEQARQWLEASLPLLEEERHIGHVEIRKVIKSSKLGKIAGCFVTQGVVRRNARVRLVRDEIVLWQGKLASLKRFKDEAKEVRENFECGIRLAGFPEPKEGDLLEVIEVKKVKQRLAG